MRVKRVFYDVKRPWVYCRVTVGERRGITVTESGFTRCNTQDRWDEAAGKELAFARAMRDAVRKYHKQLEQNMHNGRDYKPTDEVVVTVETNNMPKKEFRINVLRDTTVADLFPSGKTTCDSDPSRRLQEFMNDASIERMNAVAHDQ